MTRINLIHLLACVSLFFSISGCVFEADVDSDLRVNPDGDAGALDGDENEPDGDDPDGDDPDGEDPMDGDEMLDGDSTSADGDMGESAGEDNTTDDNILDDLGEIDVGRLIIEADIYKYNGERLLLLNPHLGLVRIDASDPAQASITGRLPMLEAPNSLYMLGDQAVLMTEWGESGGLEEGRAISLITLVEVDDSKEMSIISEKQLDGRVLDSRWVGGVIYLVLSEGRYIDQLTGEPAGRDRIRILSYKTSTSGLVAIDELDIPGEGMAVSATSSLILLSTPGDDGSMVHLVDISDSSGKISKKATLYPAGEVRDRYKMNIRENILTLVSHSDFAEGVTYVETYNINNPSAPTTLGFISLAEGEELHASIFREDMLYLVTYFRPEQVPDVEDGDWIDGDWDEDWGDDCWDGCDPLWTIDLTNPSAPKILGELIIPGWSEHMKFRDQKLFTVGYSDDWETKVAIFDVHNASLPREDAQLIIPGRIDSTDPDELYDFKSFTILWGKKLILTPVRAANNPSLAFVGFEYDEESASLEYLSDLPAFEAVRRTFLMEEYLGMLADSQLDVVDIQNQRDPKVVRNINFLP